MFGRVDPRRHNCAAGRPDLDLVTGHHARDMLSVLGVPLAVRSAATQNRDRADPPAADEHCDRMSGKAADAGQRDVQLAGAVLLVILR